MKHFKIADARTKFFASKEDYLSFRQAWKDYINEGKHKKYSHGENYLNEPLPPESDLNAIHHIIYLALCGRDIGKGFTPITSTRKLQSCNNQPYYQLRNHLWIIERLVQGDYLKSYLLPFGDTIDEETVKSALREIPTNLNDWKDHEIVEDVPQQYKYA